MRGEAISPSFRPLNGPTVAPVVTGSWRIVEMDLWDADAIDLLGPAFIEIDKGATGSFRFIAVQGFLDCRFSQRGEHPTVEFTWEGDDEGDPASGRGWAELRADGSLHGHIFFHNGDDSGFRAIPQCTRRSEGS